jgi:GT2 family glycosyltransferase
MSDRDARVLVVVPTLGERLQALARALASVVGQQGVGVDAIVVAPTSDPSLADVVERAGARLVVHGGHISAAVNEGFRRADPAHRYLAWLGDDDVLRPGALARTFRALEAAPRATVAFGRCDYVSLDGDLLFTRRPPPAAEWALQLVPGLIKQETCLFRRAAFDACGGLDETLRYAMDLDILLRLRARGPFVRVQGSLAGFCWHPGSITVANRERSFAEAQAIQRRLARGAARPLVVALQPLMRLLMMAATARINRRHMKEV